MWTLGRFALYPPPFRFEGIAIIDLYRSSIYNN